MQDTQLSFVSLETWPMPCRHAMSALSVRRNFPGSVIIFCTLFQLRSFTRPFLSTCIHRYARMGPQWNGYESEPKMLWVWSNCCCLKCFFVYSFWAYHIEVDGGLCIVFSMFDNVWHGVYQHFRFNHRRCGFTIALGYLKKGAPQIPKCSTPHLN